MVTSGFPPRSLRILIHVAAWLAMAAALIAFVQMGLGVPLQPDWRLLRILGPLALLAGFFYLNYWVLIPRLLAQRRFANYFALVVVIGLLFAMPMILRHFGVISRPPHPPRLAAYHPLQLVLVVLLLAWVVSSALRITGEWLQSEEVRKQLHSDQLAAELAFLKAQVNPHFLFNTLNNIYSLAELKSDDAPAAILKLSQLMRYMLYEAHAPRVPLSQEVGHLRTYVDLQRLRLDPDQVPIDFAVEGNTQGLLIEPMLLLPFVENAFKHGISFQHASRIGLHLVVQAHGLRFVVTNNVFEQPAAAPVAGVGGLGLHNVQQRLRLLYPERHTLRLAQSATTFTATLTLTFDTAHAALPLG